MRFRIVAVLELALLATLLRTVWVFIAGWNLSGLTIDPEPLTAAMVLLVAVFWVVYTWNAHAWTRRADTVERDGTRANTDVGGWITSRLEGLVVTLDGRPRLERGVSEQIIENLSTRDEEMNPPGWLATGQAILVSLGLLGTFLGLTLGLLQAADSLGATEPTEMASGMTKLFDGAKLAFVKSLAGVGSALVWTLRYRLVEGRHTALLHHWKDWIDDNFPPLGPAELLVRLHEVAVQADTAAADRERRVAACLQDVVLRVSEGQHTQTTKLLAGIGQVTELHAARIVEGVQESAGQQTAALTGAVERGAATLEQRLVDLADQVRMVAETLPERIGSNTSAQLVQGLEPQFHALADSLKALSSAGGQAIQDTLRDSMTGEVGTLRQSLAEVAELLQGLGPTIRTGLEAADRQVQEGASSAAKALVDAGAAASQRMEHAAGKLSAEASGVESSVQAVHAALVEAEEVARALRGAGREVATGLEGIAAPLMVLPPVLERARNSLAMAGTSLETGVERTVELAQANERAAALLGAGIERQQGLTESARTLTAEVDRVRAACEQLAAALDGMTAGQQAASAQAARELMTTVQRFGETLSTAQQNVAAASKATFADTSTATAAASARLAQVMDQGTKRLDETIARLAEYGERIDVGLRAAKTTVEAIDGSAKSLREDIEATRPPFAEVAGALGKIAPEVERASDALKAERDALAGLGHHLEAQGGQLQQSTAALGDRIREYHGLQSRLSTEWALHVKGIDELLQRIRDAWAQAKQALESGVEGNAKELATYAERVERALHLPDDLRTLDATLKDLADVLDGFKDSFRDRKTP